MAKKVGVKQHKSVTKKVRCKLVPGMEKKDLATPRSETETGLRRARRRSANRRGTKCVAQVSLQLNVISSLLAGLKTPTDAFERCLYKDALTRSQQCCAFGLSTRITCWIGCGSGCPSCRRGRKQAAEASALTAAAALLLPAVLLSLQLLF